MNFCAMAAFNSGKQGVGVYLVCPLSSAALAAIQGISQTVHGVEEIAAAISSTVDQQSSAILEVSGNIQQAAARTEQVASHLRRMSDGLGENGAAAAAVAECASLTSLREAGNPCATFSATLAAKALSSV